MLIACRKRFIEAHKNQLEELLLQLGISQTTVWRVVHNRLHLHAHRVQTVQASKPDDKLRCFQSAKDILSKDEADEKYLRRWIFSDEATFYLSGRVNYHNCRIWGSENPHVIREIERDSAKVSVWGALSCSEVLGPFFFAEQTVTAMTYLNMLRLYLLPQLEDHQPNVMFQQNGAPPALRSLLSENFLARVFLGAGLGVASGVTLYYVA
jgi:hypothetical protein